MQLLKFLLSFNFVALQGSQQLHNVDTMFKAVTQRLTVDSHKHTRMHSGCAVGTLWAGSLQDVV